MNLNFSFSAKWYIVLPKWTKQSSLSCIVMLWELINNHWHFFSAQIVKWLFTFNSFLLQLSSSFKLLTPFLMSTWRFQLKLKPKYLSTRYQIIENRTWWVFWWLLNTFTEWNNLLSLYYYTNSVLSICICLQNCKEFQNKFFYKYDISFYVQLQLVH